MLEEWLAEIWVDYDILFYTYHSQLMKSVESHGSLLLLLMMKVSDPW